MNNLPMFNTPMPVYALPVPYPRNWNVYQKDCPPTAHLTCPLKPDPTIDEERMGYKTTEQRITSFSRLSGFWYDTAPSVQKMAEAGFFYTGFFDRVVCFSCGGMLCEWKPHHDPWEQHALWFGHCAFVYKERGAHFIQAVYQTNGPVVPTDHYNRKNNDKTTLTIRYREDLQSSLSCGIKESVLLCYMCELWPTGWLNIPCGHMELCAGCCTQLPGSKYYSKNMPFCTRCGARHEEQLKVPLTFHRDQNIL